MGLYRLINPYYSKYDKIILYTMHFINYSNFHNQLQKK